VDDVSTTGYSNDNLEPEHNQNKVNKKKLSDNEINKILSECKDDKEKMYELCRSLLKK